MKSFVVPVCLGALAIHQAASAAAGPAQNSAPAAAAAPGLGDTRLLPEDPARALVIRTCVVCHPAELVVSRKRTIETWDRLISKMVDYGARADEDQQIAILTYFATYFLGTDTSTGASAPVKADPGK